MVALKTFLNLPADRKEEIIQIALEEFSLHEYSSASLSTIISRLKLAKGSFYRYFENKQSLYFYLLDVCINTRIENDKHVIQDPANDFFELLIQHLSAKIVFDKKHPLHSAFLHNVLQEKNNDELGDIRAKSKGVAIKIIKNILSQHVKKGNIRNDIDLKTLSFFVFTTQVSITEFLGFKNKIDFSERIRNRKPLYDITNKEILATAKDFSELLKNGIKVKS